ncbi:maleylpyruvate isomerase family mycothiol-dependent enzyme [Ammonicoccus fulvus]|uniref:Maleylpyruvate isomerase family mycothiol-dependent enzyme n=1 Tax=Ammonicoccus fulvus TaxID=3138240 RepID=A0ABZ3FPY3_9ACTN
MTLWEVVRAERAALAADLASLDDALWATDSLCAGWSVRDVLAHMTATARMNPATFLFRLGAARFDFHRMVGQCRLADLGSSPRQTLELFRATIDLRGGPPLPRPAMLGETLIHAEDIRRPLGIHHEYPLEDLRDVITFNVATNLVFGTRERIEGLRLVATDIDYAHGSGELVEGPLMALTLAATGRGAGCDDLAGPGAAVLRGRCP